MKYPISVCVAVFFCAILFFGCGKSPCTAGERLSRLTATVSLPAGHLYQSDADIRDESYMPESMGKNLYDIRGYSELSHAETYAVYLGSGYGSAFEIAVFQARDSVGAEDITDMCLYRGNYLLKAGILEENGYTVLRSGNTVCGFFGMTQETAQKYFLILFS